MKTLLVLIFTFSLPVFARTQSIFAAKGSKATVLLIGSPGDRDALNLFDAMTAPVEVIDGKRARRMRFNNAGGGRAFSIICVLSGILPENGTCTVSLHAGPGTSIDKNASEARFISVEPNELSQLTGSFVVPADANVIYASGDMKLQVSVSRDSGTVQSFEILYH